jgi:hypothetical protein
MRCNYCILQGIKKRAEADGKKVTVINNDIYVHDPDCTNPTDKKYWVAWLMEIPSSCCC